MMKINLNNLKEVDFKELEFDQIGVWPVEVRLLALIGIFIASLVGGYFFIVQSSFDSYSFAQRKDKEKRDEYRLSYNQASNLEQYTKQMQDMQIIVTKLLQKLPKDERVPELLEEISEQSQAAGVKLTLVRPQQKQNRQFYGELPIEIHVTGSYHKLGKFVEKISNLSRVVTLHDFVIENKSSGNEENRNSSAELTMEVTAKTYWSLQSRES